MHLNRRTYAKPEEAPPELRWDEKTSRLAPVKPRCPQHSQGATRMRRKLRAGQRPRSGRTPQVPST